MAALFLQAIIGELAALWDGPCSGGLRPANCGLRSFFYISRKTVGFVEYIIYILIYDLVFDFR